MPVQQPSSRLAPQARAFLLSDGAHSMKYRDVAWRTMTAFDMYAVEAVAAYGSSDSGASLGDILGAALKDREKK